MKKYQGGEEEDEEEDIIQVYNMRQQIIHFL